MRVSMAALTRAPVRGASVRVARPRATVRPAPSFSQLPLSASGRTALTARRSLRAVVAAAGDDGYASSDDPDVASGKRKSVSSMNVNELKAEVRVACAPR